MPELASTDLPPGVGIVTPLLGALAIFGSSWVGARLALGRAWSRFAAAPVEPWPERARLHWEVALLQWPVFVVCASLGVVLGVLLTGELLFLPPRLHAFVFALAGYFGAAAGNRSAARAHPPPEWPVLTARQGFDAGLGRWVLHRTGFLNALVLALFMPESWGPHAILVLALGAASWLWLLHGGCTQVLSWFDLIAPAPPQVADSVKRAAERVGTARPEAFLLEMPYANAMVFLLARQLLVTPKAVEAVSARELHAIFLHECGHLAEPKSVAIAHASSGFAVLALAALIPTIELGLLALYGVLAICLLLLVLPYRIARSMELRADAIAAGHEEEGGAYARALETLYRVNLTPVVMPGKVHPHPHLYDRMVAAGLEPAYERPAAPRRAALASVLLAALPVGALVLAVTLVREAALDAAWRDASAPPSTTLARGSSTRPSGSPGERRKPIPRTRGSSTCSSATAFARDVPRSAGACSSSAETPSRG